MIESAVTLLPQPDSPTMPSARPAVRLKVYVVDREHDRRRPTRKSSAARALREAQDPSSAERSFVAASPLGLEKRLIAA